MPDDVSASQLEASARRELRGLGRLNAENVARHLVMVQRLLDTDPQAAYDHARYAASHAGRIAVVREAAAIASYLSEHYHEALRDLRAARRLSGLDLHRAIEADCERALGRLDRALKVAEQADPHQLDDVEEAELAMVVSGVRHELGQTELGLVVIEDAIMMFRGDRETLRRLHSVRADRLEELGRVDEAETVRRRLGPEPAEPEPDVEVYDMEAEAAADAPKGAESSAEAADEPEAVAPQPEDAPVPSPATAAYAAAAGASSASAPSAPRTLTPDDDADFAARVEAEMAELLGEDAQ